MQKERELEIVSLSGSQYSKLSSSSAPSPSSAQVKHSQSASRGEEVASLLPGEEQEDEQFDLRPPKEEVKGIVTLLVWGEILETAIGCVVLTLGIGAVWTFGPSMTALIFWNSTVIVLLEGWMKLSKWANKFNKMKCVDVAEDGDIFRGLQRNLDLRFLASILRLGLYSIFWVKMARSRNKKSATCNKQPADGECQRMYELLVVTCVSFGIHWLLGLWVLLWGVSLWIASGIPVSFLFPGKGKFYAVKNGTRARLLWYVHFRKLMTDGHEGECGLSLPWQSVPGNLVAVVQGKLLWTQKELLGYLKRANNEADSSTDGLLYLESLLLVVTDPNSPKDALKNAKEKLLKLLTEGAVVNSVEEIKDMPRTSVESERRMHEKLGKRLAVVAKGLKQVIGRLGPEEIGTAGTLAWSFEKVLDKAGNQPYWRAWFLYKHAAILLEQSQNQSEHGQDNLWRAEANVKECIGILGGDGGEGFELRERALHTWAAILEAKGEHDAATACRNQLRPPLTQQQTPLTQQQTSSRARTEANTVAVAASRAALVIGIPPSAEIQSGSEAPSPVSPSMAEALVSPASVLPAMHEELPLVGDVAVCGGATPT